MTITPPTSESIASGKESRFTREALRLSSTYKVFPCTGKIPSIPLDEGGHGVLDATQDEATIREWGKKYPDANVAVAFFEDSLEVGIDVDVDNFWWLDQRQRQHGPFETRTTRTGSGGFHYYYLRPKGRRLPNVAKKANKGFECKSVHAYLMAPGSIHPDPPHNVYELVNDIDPQPMPEWLISEIEGAFSDAPGDNGNGHKKSEPRTTPIFEHEGRNAACAAEAGRLIKIYKDPEIVKPMVRAYNQAVCVPPLTEDELERTVWKSLEKWATREDAAAPATPIEDALHRTDLGNMHRFITLHGDKFRWCEGPDTFMVWQGKFWEKGNHLVMELAKDVPKQIYREAAELPDERDREDLIKWGMQSESKVKLAAFVELAKTDPRIHTFPNDYEKDPWLLNCRNGTVNLRTGDIKPQERNDFITRMIDHDATPGLRSETWDKFVEQILPDTATRAFVKQAVGYSLNGTQDEQIVLFCYGEGNNGKSTFLDAIRAVLGPYGHECEPDIFMQRKFGRDSKSPDEEVGNLHRKRFVTATELEDDQTLATTFLKRASGGEELTCNMKYSHSFKFKPEFTLWMSGNHQPKVNDRTNSIWRRLREIPFTQTIPPEERIKGYGDMLVYNYGDAILSWAIEGSVECVDAGGLTASDAVMKATEAYRKDQDTEWQFLNSDRAFIDLESPKVEADTKLLYEAYKTWWNENIDSRAKPLGKKKFNAALRDRLHFQTRLGTGNRTYWKGIGLIVDDTES